MENTYLTESDYTKILSFIAQIKKNNNDFQQHVLNLLHDIFGFKHVNFNLINHKLETFNSRLCNITENAKAQYYDYYHKTDIFSPKNSLNLWNTKNVITISDIMPISQFEKTEFYIDFLKKDMLYYELVLPLKANNRLIGGIGVFKEKDENNFSNRDIAILSRLNEFISNDLCSYLEYSSIQKECQTYHDCFEETPTGIIILDQNFAIKRYNRAAEIFAGKLRLGNSPHSSMQQFIYEIISKFSAEINNPHADITFFYKTYKINIMFNLIPSVCESLDSVYMIFITEENENKLTSPDSLRESYNLTAREADVLSLVKDGLSNEEIAKNLFISTHTVKSHMENIFKKLQVKNRTAALNKINKTH